MSAEEIMRAARNCIASCMGVKAGENVLIITDPPRLDLAQSMREAAREINANCEIILLPNPSDREKNPLNSPSDILLAAITASNVILNFFEGISSELRPFRTTIVTKGREYGRVGHMIGLDRVSFEKGGLLADCNQVAEYSDLLAMILSKAKSLTIKSGPNLEYELRFKDLGGWYELASSDSGKLCQKGNLGNLPAGEAFMAISLARIYGIEGEICVDRYIEQVGHINTACPIILTIIKGVVTKIEGGQAHILEENLNESEKTALNKQWNKEYVRRIAEIGIGTNPKAQIGASTIETEKRLGTIHIALGDNSMFGGPYKAPNHFDCVIERAELKIDNKSVLKEGKLEDLRTLRKAFEENLWEYDCEKIDNKSIIAVTCNKSDVSISKDNELFKNWQDHVGRNHQTRVGDSDTSKMAARIWEKLEMKQTVEEILYKTQFDSNTLYRAMRLLQDYLLIDIVDKSDVEYLQEIQTQFSDNFTILNRYLLDVKQGIGEINEQDKIYYDQILDGLELLNDYINKTDAQAIKELIKRINTSMDELTRKDRPILSSKVTLSAGLPEFLGFPYAKAAVELDIKALFLKIKEKLSRLSDKI